MLRPEARRFNPTRGNDIIRLTDNIWVGDSADGWNLGPLKFGAVLNVAQDLCGKCGWPDVEYMQVGLIDGPGNPLAAYYAAVLALTTLVKRSKTLVCCHTGSRSMAVVLMYMNTTVSREWGVWLELLRERLDVDLPVPHEAHKAAFSRMNWRMFSDLMEN